MLNVNTTYKVERPKREFWVFNTVGWSLMTVINIVFQTHFLTDNFDAIFYSFIVTGVGFLASIVSRHIILKFKIIDKKTVGLFLSLFVITILISILSVALITLLIYLSFPEKEIQFSSSIGALFNFSMIFFLWTLIYVSYIFIKKQSQLAEQKYKLSLQLKEAELNNLRKQLSPHFLFNAINNIRSLILINPESARDALLNVSDLLRYALSYQKKNSVTVLEEMEIVEGYINLNKIHLGDTVNFSINLDNALEDLKIPPMSIQLLIENAIKHGQIMNGEVTLNIKVEQNKSIIEVINPGTLKTASDNGIGLTNLKQRLQSMYGSKASFSIIEKNGFVTAKIEIK